MKKIKDLTSFIKQFDSHSVRLRIIISIIRAIFEIPAFVFHEFMHFIFAFVLASNLEVFDVEFFNVSKYNLSMYNLGLKYDSYRLNAILISLAPMIGWTIMVILIVERIAD